MNKTKGNETNLSRREFLGNSTRLAFVVALGANGLTLMSESNAKAAGHEIGVWVTIFPDNQITILTPAAEMGQGSMTGVPIVLAEELDANWDKVTLEWAPAEPETYGYSCSPGGGSRVMEP